MRKILKVFLWGVAIIFAAFIILVIARIPHVLEKDKTDAAVAKIHATKLTLDDVMGKNLSPDPGADADKTIQGVDANHNGIRDDVELAIFKEYPNSAKTRAVLLQYALALQLEAVQPIVNTEIVTAVIEDDERALSCIWSISSRSDMKKFLEETTLNENFVKLRQLNTEQRKKYQHDFYEYLGSHGIPHQSCDLNISTLPN